MAKERGERIFPVRGNFKKLLAGYSSKLQLRVRFLII